jgi:hypothetical protein
MRHVIGFQDWKAPRVESGELRQTIRKPRKRPIKVGDTLRLYQGLRTTNCRFLGEAKCIAMFPISLSTLPCPFVGCDGQDYALHILNGLPYVADIEDLAKRDGFTDSHAMCEWFDKKHGLPFAGIVIRWGELRHG